MDAFRNSKILESIVHRHRLLEPIRSSSFEATNRRFLLLVYRQEEELHTSRLSELSRAVEPKKFHRIE